MVFGGRGLSPLGRGDLQAGRAAGKAACKAETEMENPGPLCLSDNLFPQQFPSPVFFGLLEFNLVQRGRERCH